MSLSPADDYLPESFFTTLYPDLGMADPAAAAAQDSSSRLARLVEFWPGAVFCLDARLRCVVANRDARNWCHGPVDLTQPGTLNELLFEDLVQALLPCLPSALRGLEHEFEGEFRHPSLGMRWLRVRVQPDHCASSVQGLFLHLSDQTEQRQKNRDVHDDNRRLLAQVREHAEQLGASEARFRLMAEGIRDVGIFFLNGEGRISEWTTSAERLLGFSPSEALDQPADRFDPADTPGEENDTFLALERATLLGQCESVGWRVRHDGSQFWAHTVFTALNDPRTGETSGYSCLMRDMTEVKRLEDLLRQLNQELEARVEERTRQLQDINQDLESFSYSVSHDLRAPLRHIGSFVNMLREELENHDSPDVQRHLDTIGQAADHMGQLIEGLLAFSRLGRAPLQRKSVAMSALLQSSMNRVQHDPALHRPPEAVRWELTPDLPEVQGDALLLSQVWDNLLANALKYSRPREMAEIAVGWNAVGDGELVFWVRDNGVGFDPRRADKLFGVFQRLHRAKEFEGTGIGLALCRRIVERHGGRVWAESEPGKGSTFFFALPTPGTTGSAQQVQVG